jgi:methyltransferase (TIGR00027 family)
MSAVIKHVSDTALWVATFRANETQRADGLFKDPLAEKLIGEHGRKIGSEMPHSEIMEWIMVMRTLGIDRLVTLAIELGVETVVNLGAGLDTRPYRMNLPRHLEWIEVDFPDLINYKNERLSADEPRCLLERVAIDLSDATQRRAFLQQLETRSRKTLVITEGVLLYLDSEQATDLSKDLLATPTVKYWIQDYRNQSLDDWAPPQIRDSLKDSSPFKFNPDNWLAFFEAHGWETKDFILAAEVALRAWRPFPYPFPWNILTRLAPSTNRKGWSHANGYVLFGRKITNGAR